MRKLSEAQKGAIAEKVESGELTPQQAAEQFGVSVSCITWTCMRLGADVPPHRRGRHARLRRAPMVRGNHLVRPFTPDEDARLLELDHQGLTPTEIGRAMGRKQNSIRGRMLTLGRQASRAEDRPARDFTLNPELRA